MFVIRSWYKAQNKLHVDNYYASSKFINFNANIDEKREYRVNLWN